MHALRRDERASEGTEVVLVLLQGHDIDTSTHLAQDGKNLLAAAAPHPQEDRATRHKPQKLAHQINRGRRSADRISHDQSRARGALNTSPRRFSFLLLGHILQMLLLLSRPRHTGRASRQGESASQQLLVWRSQKRYGSRRRGHGINMIGPLLVSHVVSVRVLYGTTQRLAASGTAAKEEISMKPSHGPNSSTRRPGGTPGIILSDAAGTTPQ